MGIFQLINKYSDINGYVYFNELLFAAMKRCYGTHFLS